MVVGSELTAPSMARAPRDRHAVNRRWDGGFRCGRLADVKRTSERLAAIAPSATLAVDAKAKALQAAGENVIGFGAGEPDFPTPAHIVEAAVEACRDPKNHQYSPAGGLARAEAGDRGQDAARFGLRMRAVAGAGDQRRQARRVHRVRCAVRSGRRGDLSRRRTGPPIPRRSRSPEASRSSSTPTRRVASRSRSSSSTRPTPRARRSCCSSAPTTRPVRCVRPTW